MSSDPSEPEIFIAADSKGNPYGPASEKLAQNRSRIAERRATLSLLEAFIDAHHQTLAGLSWRIAYVDAEIEIHPGWYRTKRVATAVIAQLWPDADWQRVTPKYDDETKPTRDWVTIVDGIRLRIEKAETYKPVNIPADGPVDLHATDL